MKVYIKHMVGLNRHNRVQKLLSELGLRYSFVDRGEIEVFGKVTSEDQQRISRGIQKLGLSLISGTDHSLSTKTLEAIKKFALNREPSPKKSLKEYLSTTTDSDYDHLKDLVLAIKGVSIEHYVVQLKVNRATELLLYSKKSTTEIAKELNYSSQMLVARFKGQTGLSPLFFKKIGKKNNQFAKRYHFESSTGK